jgi:hypothetical protein
VMLMTKRAKFLARHRRRHRSPFKTHLQIRLIRKLRARGARWLPSILNSFP